MAKVSRAESVIQTRQALLAAAESEFAEVGFAAATLEQIAKKAGCTRGAIYANFAGKPELFLALLDSWLETQIQEYGAQISADTEIADLLSWLGGEAGNRFADREKFLLFTEFRLYAIRHPELLPKLVDFDRRSIDWFATVIRRFAEPKFSGQAEAMARAILAMEMGISALAHTDPSLPQAEFVKILVETSKVLGKLPKA